MRKPLLALCVSVVATIALTLLARAQFSGGGHDETTEDLTNATSWNTAAGQPATPGTVPAGVTGTHLLISEVGIRGVNSATLGDSTEFIEIYNPTASSVDLSHFYISDVSGYSSLPRNGTVDLGAVITDFAFKFPNNTFIGPGQAKVIAVDGGRYRRGTGVNAAFMLFYSGGNTNAMKMVDVGSNKGVGYPGFGSLTNGGESIWLFYWDGQSDLVCDVDMVYWGTPIGSNMPVLKTTATCQDGPDLDPTLSCYLNDAGNPAGSFGKALALPADGAGTRQRIGPETELVTSGGNGCIPCPAITISPGSLPGATVNHPYHEILTPSAGTPPFVFTATNGPLPPGMKLSGTGTILYGCDPNGVIFTVDLVTGVGTATGVSSPIPPTEIEYDFNSGATFAQGRDGYGSGQLFDIQTGAILGPFVSDGGAFQGLEYVASSLYGTFVSSSNGPSSLAILDPMTGGATVIGPTGRGPISGLAYDASSGTMYGIDGGGLQQGAANLLTLNLSTGAATVVGPTGITAGSLEFGPDGKLYAGGDATNGGHLYRIDRATGGGTLVGTTGFYSVSGLTLGPGGAGAEGVLSGIPTGGGSYTFTVNVADAYGCSGHIDYKLDVACPTVTISPSTLPPDTVGKLVNVTLTSDGVVPVTFDVTSGSLPPGLVLYNNYSYAQIYGVPTVTGSFPFTVSVTDAAGCHGSIDYKIDVLCMPLTISPTTLPTAPYGSPYNVVLTTDGRPPVVFDQKGGSLPPGLNLDPSGTISGTPTATGSFGFTVGATDSNGCRGTRDYKITVIVCPPITISPATLPPGTVKVPYHQVLTPSDGTPPFVFTAKDSMPPGLSLSGTGTVLYGCDPNGAIFTVDLATGAGTFSGYYAPTYNATEIEHDFLTGQAFVQGRDGSFYGQRFDIQTGAVLGPSVYDGASFQGLEYVGSTLYGTSVFGSGGPSTLGTLDPVSGATVAIGATGRGPISGLAYDAGSGTMYGIDGRASNGPANLLTLNLTTGAATVVGSTGITAGSLEFGPDGNLYAGGDGADGGHLYRVDRSTGAATLLGPTGFFAVTGLTLGPGGPGPTGVLSGIPTAVGSFTLMLNVTDANGCNGSVEYKLDVNCPPLTISPTTLPPAIVGNLVNDTLRAEGAPPLGFEVTAGSLPPGVALYSIYSYALIYGVPTATGSFPFTVGVRDSHSCHGSIDYKLDVQCRPLVLAPATLPNAPYGEPYGVTLTSDGRPPVVFDQKGGSLPPGLNLDPAGTISGTPTATGSFGFTIGATDSNGCRGTRDYKITVVVCPPITISPASLPPGTVKVPYHQILTPSDGTPPFVFTAKDSMPPGLSLSGTGTILYGCDPNGAIFTVDLTTGAGTYSGYYAPTYSATEIEHDLLTGETFVQGRDGSFVGQRFDIQTGVAFAPTVFDGASFQGLEYVGSTLYGTSVTGPGGPSTLSILDPVTGATTPIGATGRGPISGLAYYAAGGTMYGIDGGGRSGPANLLTLNLSTGAATVVGSTGITAGSLEFGPDGNLYAGGDAVDGGRLYRVDRLTGAATLVGPTGFFAVTGLTPGPGGPGPTGVLSGIPLAGGSFPISVNVTDANGCHGSIEYKLVISCPELALAPDALPPGQVKDQYNQPVAVIGGSPPYSFFLNAGSLPPGLTLGGNTDTLRITGVLAAAGKFAFTIGVLDHNGCVGQHDYSIAVSCPAITLNPELLPDGVTEKAYSQTLTPKAGSPPFTVVVTGGALPPGLGLKEQVLPFAGVRERAGARLAAARSVVLGSRPRAAANEPLTGNGTINGSVRNSLTPALNDTTKGPRILFALADFDAPVYRAAIASLIGGTVDFFECAPALGGTTPSPELLASYDCVLTKPNYPYEDRVLMGDRLADYVDGGGKVILGVFSTLDESFFPGYALQGRIMTPAYSPVVSIPGSTPFSRGDYAGDGTTCIHTGVAAYGCNYHDQLAIQGGGTADGHYLQDGSIAHAFRPDGRVIYSNGHGDSTVYGGTGDWPRLIANACACSPHPVQIVISGTPTEFGTFHFTLSFTDHNGCSGEQNFTIRVLDQATATQLSLFQARPVDGGLELRWQFGDPRMFSAVELERGATALGPWAAVAAELRDENGVTVALDRDVEPGRMYYYRLRATAAAGTTTIFGPFAQTAGQAIAEFALVSLAPNPSAGQMRIDFTMPRAAAVRLSVLDVLGREVAVLADGTRPPGRYQATWNGEDARGRVPAGLYFVRFRTPAGSFVRRAVLTR